MRSRAVTAGAFFLGLALISASLVEFARWSYVEGAFSGDFAIKTDDAWLFNLTDVIEDARLANPIPAWADNASFLSAPQAVLWWMVPFGAAGLVAVALVAAGKRSLGAWALPLCTLVGVAPSVLLGLEYRVLPYLCRTGFLCHCSHFSPPGPPVLVGAISFVAVMAVLISAAWIIAQYQHGFAPPPSAWVAAGAALAMLGVALIYARAAAEPMEEHAWRALGFYGRLDLMPPERPFGWLAALLSVGLVLAVRAPLYVSRLASTAVLLLGLVLAAPALAIIHDDELAQRTRHDGGDVAISLGDAIPLPTTKCDAVELATEIRISSSEVTLSGMTIGSFEPGAVEAPLVSALEEDQKRWVDLYAQAGETPPEALTRLIVDRRAPIDVVRQALRAISRLGGSRISLLSRRAELVPAWVRPTRHHHVCSLPLLLGTEGQSVEDFTDWPALVRAADEAKGTLVLRVR